jgi:hypothetical protein
MEVTLTGYERNLRLREGPKNTKRKKLAVLYGFGMSYQ